MRSTRPQRGPRPNEVWSACAECAPYFGTAAAFSVAVNVLYLAPSIYMMQIYDRVLSSANIATLVLLTLILIAALVTSAALEALRSRILLRAGVRLDRRLAPRITAAAIGAARAGGPTAGPLEEFEGLKQGATGPGATAVLDLPWVPVHVLVLGLMHPALGVFAAVGGAVLLTVAIFADRATRTSSDRAATAAKSAGQCLDHALADAPTVTGLGMTGNVVDRYTCLREASLAARHEAGERGAVIQSATRTTRQALQSLVMALGAYLVIEQVASVGVMFAASLLLGRALQPLEQLAASWRGLIAARGAYANLGLLLSAEPPIQAATFGQQTAGHLSCNGLGYLPRAGGRPIVYNVNLRFEPGQLAVIIGPTGSGKSTLLRLLSGGVPPSAGAVRIDGLETSHSLISPIGYLPQDVDLLPGTVAENIARFGALDETAIVAAAQRAGAHEAITQLPRGYETAVGPAGVPVSAGTRQRIGLARALHGSPRIIVLDEPGRDLDAAGETVMTRMLLELRREGATIVVVSHRPPVIAAADVMIVLQAGTVIAAGPKGEVLARTANPRANVGKVVAWPA